MAKAKYTANTEEVDVENQSVDKSHDSSKLTDPDSDDDSKKRCTKKRLIIITVAVLVVLLIVGLTLGLVLSSNET